MAEMVQVSSTVSSRGQVSRCQTFFLVVKQGMVEEMVEASGGREELFIHRQVDVDIGVCRGERRWNAMGD